MSNTKANSLPWNGIYSTVTFNYAFFPDENVYRVWNVNSLTCVEVLSPNAFDSFSATCGAFGVNLKQVVP